MINKIFAAICGVIWTIAMPVSAEGVVSITASNGFELTQDTDRFDVYYAGDEGWDFRGGYGLWFRIHSGRMDEAPEARSDELDGRNTLIGFYTEIDGKRTLIACRGPEGEDPVGWIERSALTDTEVAGSFEATFTRCFSFYEGTLVEYEHLPITATGTFSVELKSLY